MDVLAVPAEKILAEIATPAKRMAGDDGSPMSPGRLGAGASLKDFELLEKLGKGNCGTVHKARRIADGKLYVIKQIDIVALHPDELQQAVVEAQVTFPRENISRLPRRLSRPTRATARGSAAASRL